ncbi:hypothetical protein FACS189413_03300 [Bacteroidia bacterium]|nr:hypothetical protein FACS189413_03300 [Bacteroidia bacterium]
MAKDKTTGGGFQLRDDLLEEVSYAAKKQFFDSLYEEIKNFLYSLTEEEKNKVSYIGMEVGVLYFEGWMINVYCYKPYQSMIDTWMDNRFADGGAWSLLTGKSIEIESNDTLFRQWMEQTPYSAVFQSLGEQDYDYDADYKQGYDGNMLNMLCYIFLMPGVKRLRRRLFEDQIIQQTFGKRIPVYVKPHNDEVIFSDKSLIL